MQATDNVQQMALRALRPVAVLAGLAAGCYLLAIVWAGPEVIWQTAGRLGWVAVAAAASVVALGFACRYARWVLLLHGFGHRLPTSAGLPIYLCGLALTSTPGKAGETLRSVFLLRHGVRLPESLAAFFADRLSDVIGVALLGALAAAWIGDRAPVLEVLAVTVLLLSFGIRALVRRPGLAGAMSRWPIGAQAKRWAGILSLPVRAWALVWTPGRVPLYVLAALLAYGVQGLVFAYFSAALALPLPALRFVAMFASATLLGAASMVPAGLGVMDAALVLQLTQAGASSDAALAVAFMTRLVTLWFGLLVGVLALLHLGWRKGQAQADEAAR